ncbi:MULTISPECIES: hypothetical protein [unclassified Nocardioides]|uniref:hypothetical protein n=1 Tax=unclassified Nocardioides TaxID=2615069 RepID=UPI001150DF91|nr:MULTISPECIES: hypothetical protein [unclassified Nocardioides]WGY00248.1 hypothetical protein QI633_17080 [Nocardioides sp. QY071]
MGLDITRSGLVVPVRIDPSGRAGPTPGQVRGRRWRTAGPYHFVPADVALTTQQRILEAVACLPPGSAATGWAALSWLEARWFDGVAADGSALPVPVALGDRRVARKRPGVTLSEDWLFADDVVVIDGLPVTIPLRSVTFEARTASDDIAAVRAIDMAAYDDLVDLASLHAYTARLISRRGKRRLERALAVADENAWSPMEVVMRRIWHQHRSGILLCNAPIFDLQGRHLFTPDLLDPVAGVAGDYDGVDHLEGGRHSRDLMREELTRRAGIEVVTMMAGRGEAARFRYRLDGALARAAGPTVPRTWTLAQPDWWVDTSTVARRRALTPAQREIWLRHRRT